MSTDWSAIFVHAGAGYHSLLNEPQHLRACANACRAAMAMLRNGGSAIDGVEIALRSLEDNEITNAGYGSNLALDGSVECDASIMDETGRSGAVGAVESFKNPSALARLILDNSRRPMSLKRVPPILVVGQGSRQYAEIYNFPMIKNADLISPAAYSRWCKWKRELDNIESNAARRAARSHASRSRKSSPHETGEQRVQHAGPLNVEPGLEQEEDVVTDTVGAICVDRWGRVAAGSSSGGIGMKFKGRVGPAALIGIGTWIKADENGLVVASTCSGTGEQMANTMVATKATERIFSHDDELLGMQECIDRDFMGSPVVRNSNMSSAVGVMSIKVDKAATAKRIHFVYGHTTDSMALAHMSTSMREPATVMSRNKRNPKSCLGGTVVRISA